MTRRPYRFDPLHSGLRSHGPDRYFCEWAVVVGQRIRRLRLSREWALIDLCGAVDKPDGGRYTPGFFSRLERGWGSGPLTTYVNVANAFDVDAGLLLGPDDAQREVSQSEMTLIEIVRRMRLTPAEAIARLARLELDDAGLAG
jgi:transcriptional regulator with XRE-family HTH domain